MSPHITLIGQGEIGSAILHILRQRPDLTVNAWDKNVHIVPQQPSLNTIIPKSNIIFLCVPTWSARGALQMITSLLAPDTIIVTPCKGFEKETCMNVYELFTRNLPQKTPLVFLGGPMIAEELLADLPTVAVVASNNATARKSILDIFLNTTLALQTTDDIRGAIIAGALKNIYALGLGIGDALNIGSNVHGVLVAIAAQEMMDIVEHYGGKPETALGLAGLGDLVATSQSTNSTNYSTGVRFAQGLPPLHGSEAMNAVTCIAPALADILHTLPFLQAIRAIVLEGKNVQDAMRAVLIHHK